MTTAVVQRDELGRAGAGAAPAQVAYLLRDRLGSTIGMADRWGDFNGTDPGFQAIP